MPLFKNFGTKPLLLAGETVYKIVGKRFEQYLQESGYDVTRVQFNGESSTNEVNRVTEIGKENQLRWEEEKKEAATAVKIK